jgi:hypothetical protein
LEDEFLEKLSDYQLLKEATAQWSYLVNASEFKVQEVGGKSF